MQFHHNCTHSGNQPGDLPVITDSLDRADLHLVSREQKDHLRLCVWREHHGKLRKECLESMRCFGTMERACA